MSAPRKGSRTTSGEAARARRSSSTDCSAASPIGAAAAGEARSAGSWALRPRPLIGRGGSCQMVGTRVGPSASSGQMPASCVAHRDTRCHSLSTPLRAIAAAVGQSVAPISRTTSPEIMLCPSASDRNRVRSARQAGCDLLDQLRQVGAREAAPAGPGLVRRD